MSDMSLSSVSPPPARSLRSRKPLLIILGLGMLLIGAAVIYLYCTYNHPVGSGPAGPVVGRAAFEQAWTTRPVLLVGLGDSITAGFGARRGYGYFNLIVTNSPDDFADMKGLCLSAVLPRLTFANLSVSGSISHEVAGGQSAHIPKVGEETLGLVVITTGGNDLIHNYGRTPPREQAMYGATWEEAKPWIDGFEVRLQKIVHDLAARFPGGCHIFLADIYDPSDGVGNLEMAGLPKWPDGLKILAAYNDVIHRCAKQNPNVHIVGLHKTFLGHGLHCGQFWSKHYDSKDPHYWYYSNLEDPNERGYDAIRRLFLIELAKVASEGNFANPVRATGDPKASAGGAGASPGN